MVAMDIQLAAIETDRYITMIADNCSTLTEALEPKYTTSSEIKSLNIMDVK